MTKIGGPVGAGRSSENLYELTSTSGVSKLTTYKREVLEEEGCLRRGERVNGDLLKWDSGVFKLFVTS